MDKLEPESFSQQNADHGFVSSATKRFSKSLHPEFKGGEGAALLLAERDKDGLFGRPNSFWLLTLLRPQGRPLPIVPILVYSAYCSVVLVACMYGLGLESNTVVRLATLSTVSTLLGLAVFLLLSFRNQAAYSRWWEGASAFQSYCGVLKELSMLTAAMHTPKYPKEAEELIWWLVASLEAGKAQLRDSQDYSYLRPIIPDPAYAELLTAEDKVMYCWYRFMALLVTLEHFSNNEIVKFHPVAARDFQHCVRILDTPLPFVYLAHMRTFLFIWLALLPWIFAGQFKWWTMLLCIVICYGVLGVEEAAVEVEHPFGLDFNDLPLDQITQGVYRSLHEMASITRGEFQADPAKLEALRKASVSGSFASAGPSESDGDNV